MNKIIKTAKALDAFFKVMCWLTIITAALATIPLAICLILSISAPALLDQISLNLVTTLYFGSVHFTLAPEITAAAAGSGTFYLIAGCGLAIVEFILYLVMIRCIRQLLAPMKEGLPFTAEATESFRKMGWLVFFQGVLGLVYELAGNGTLLRAYDLEALFLSEKITSVSFNYSLDFTFLVIALVFFGLSYVFRYGQELQKLSDETL